MNILTGSTLFVEEAYKIFQKMSKQGLPSDQLLTSLQISHISGTEVVVKSDKQKLTVLTLMKCLSHRLKRYSYIFSQYMGFLVYS